MITEDYIMRMIKDFTTMLLALAGKGRSNLYEAEEKLRVSLSDEPTLFQTLSSLIEKGEINKAENLLFDEVDFENPEDFILAVRFFDTLNEKDNDFLESHDYSREEILEGLRDIADKFGIDSDVGNMI